MAKYYSEKEIETLWQMLEEQFPFQFDLIELDKKRYRKHGEFIEDNPANKYFATIATIIMLILAAEGELK